MSNTLINLPKTAFSMKANLPVREPEILEYWQKINLYKELRNSSKGKEKKFNGVLNLKKQIKEDCKKARAILSNE